MARIGHCKWLGKTFYAELIEERPDGAMFMKALQKGHRFEVGSRILVQPGEVVEWLSELPPEIAGPAPTAEMASQSPATTARPFSDEGGAVRPTQPPATGAEKEPTMSISKINALNEKATEFNANLAKDLDATMKRYDEVDGKKQRALGKHHSHLDAVHKNLDSTEAAIDRLANVPLDGG